MFETNYTFEKRCPQVRSSKNLLSGLISTYKNLKELILKMR